MKTLQAYSTKFARSIFKKIVTEICRMIEAAKQNINLATLAATARLSMYHFHRLFRAVIGLTSKAYWAAHRTKKYEEH